MKLLTSAFILIAFLTFQFSATAQEENIDKYKQIRNSKHSLGLAAGVSTGCGLAYQYKPGKFSVMAAFAPFKDEYSTNISAGLTFIYRIKEGDRLNFFLYQANHLIIDRSTNVWYEPYYGCTGDYNTGTSNNDRINNGLGLGFELFLGRSFTFNIMGGYGAKDSFKEIGLTGETSLFYNF